MAIPLNTRYMPPKTIVYATEFEEEDVYAIRKLSEIAKAFDTEIKVVQIVTQKEYSGETQMEWVKEMLKEKVWYDNMEFKLFFSDEIFESLHNYLGDVNTDLMVML